MTGMRQNRGVKCMIIGITGGVGSGKSTVLHMLKEEYGASIYMADEYGHMAFMPDYPSFKAIVELFGASILDRCGGIDRDKMAEIVYADDKKLKRLNAIVHPFVWQHIEEDIEKNHESRLHIIESAILIEAGYESMCDKIWGVFTPDEIRIQRLIDSRGYTREKALQIIKNQMSTWELRSRVDEVIENDGDLSYLRKQLEKLLGRTTKI